MNENIRPQSKSWITADEAYTRWIKRFDATPANDHKFRSGFETHDKTVGHFQRGAMCLVGARPGVGKTSYLLALARRQAMQGVKVFYLNLEMNVEDMWNRLYCLEDESAHLQRLTQRDFNDAEVARILEIAPKLVNISPWWLEDSDFGGFVKLCKDTVEMGSKSIIMIDYLGLLSMRGLGPGDNFALMSELAKQIKLLARAFNIPVVAAVQLNREIEKRKDGSKIVLADLRGSGELENHADAILALSRDGDELDVSVLKNRNGPLGHYTLRFDESRAAVEAWE
jgi:replicative DNA helicase